MKTSKIIYVFILLILPKLSQALQPSFNDDLSRFAKDDSVGLSILISHKDEIIYEDSVGLANIELGVPLKTEHLFEIGSLTKQFTAVAVLLLEQKGELSLNDSISEYISGIASTQGTVTLRHLLSHTSGLVDPINSPEFLTTRIQEKVSLEDLIEQFKNGHWEYSAGELYNYSNVGYSMLASVVEKVSNMTYEEFLKTNIFLPLNMHNTHQASFSIFKDKATGYTFDDMTPRHHDFLDLRWAYGAADILSTTSDLNVFTLALMSAKVINNKQLTKLLSPVKTNDNELVGGSYNYSLAPIWGAKAISISGSTMGYSSASIFLPETQHYIVVLNNSDGINGGGWVQPSIVARKLAATLLKYPVPSFQEVPSDNLETSRYIGHYRLNKETTMSLSYSHGKFYYQRNNDRLYQVLPMGNDSFYFSDTLAYFKIEQGDKARTMSFYYFSDDEPEIAVSEQ